MKVLIVEDETAFRQVVVAQMQKDGIDAVGVSLGREGLDELGRGDYDMVVTDLRLPDIDGLEVIKEMHSRGSEIPVLLMTAYASVATAVTALQSGAADYVIKPVRVPDLIRRVRQIHELDQLKRENTLLRQIVQQDVKNYWLPDTPGARRVKHAVTKISGSDITVLVTGESGTGKGMTAKLIHSLSARCDKPLVQVNCGAIPDTLVESELFGHVKGAFTGADKANDGLFVSANGGTLFLDEIGELPLNIQVKLLHAIEEKVVRPVGANRGREVDVRIIAATNRNLETMVQEGTFRTDLFYRLNVFQITIPALREQKEVIPSAVDFILNRFRTLHKRKVQVADDAMDAMQAYSWPGNLRELENVLERALLLCDNGIISPAELPPSIVGHASAPAATTFDIAGGSAVGFRERVAAFERQLILQAIEEAGGDRRVAARNLGVGLSTLYRKLEELAP
ncbi:MAG: sigma-54 dependent transcriptional regulator [Alphaproteobacteria bacterium]